MADPRPDFFQVHSQVLRMLLEMISLGRPILQQGSCSQKVLLALWPFVIPMVKIIWTPFFKLAGHHICDDSWSLPPPLITSGAPKYSKLFKHGPDDSRRDPRSTKQMSSKCSTNHPKSFQHNLCLPSELPQLTPKTPNNHQRNENYIRKASERYPQSVFEMCKECKQKCQLMSNRCPKYHQQCLNICE